MEDIFDTSTMLKFSMAVVDVPFLRYSENVLLMFYAEGKSKLV